MKSIFFFFIIFSTKTGNLKLFDYILIKFIRINDFLEEKKNLKFNLYFFIFVNFHSGRHTRFRLFDFLSQQNRENNKKKNKRQIVKKSFSSVNELPSAILLALTFLF